MIWGYLEQFWNAIIGVGEYTIEFFQSIGNAVAGAIGSLFEFINHNVSDVFVFAGWLFYNLKILVSNLFLPVRFIYTYLRNFVESAFLSSETSAKAIWSFPAEIMNFFQGIPYWSILSSVLGLGILIIIGIATLKHLRHI